MLRHDYVIRQILQLVKVVARIVRKLVAGHVEEADEEVRRELAERTGLDLDVVGMLDPASLVEVVGGRGAGGSEPVRMLTTAELLGLWADICETRGEVEAATSWRVKALTLYLGVHELLAHEQLDVARGRLKVLLVSLHEVELPEVTRIGLVRYHVSTGTLDRAEDLLFELLDENLGGEALIDEAITLYSSLLKRPDAELEAGGLPRDEVLQGLDELRQRAARLEKEPSPA